MSPTSCQTAPSRDVKLKEMGRGGFEPPKALPADLQSVPFGHSGNPPYEILQKLELVDGFARLRASHGGCNVPPAHCQEPPFESVRTRMRNFGAGGRIRTPDLLITNQLLYQLSYTSTRPADIILADVFLFVNNKVVIYRQTFSHGKERYL